MNTHNFFSACNTLEEVKALYKTLAKIHHPDKGGNLATMQALNNEYSRAIATIARGGKFTHEEAEAEILKAEAYQQAINKVAHLENVTLELVGSWLWITGNTKPYANLLKSDPAKFRWAKKKTDFSAWFFRTEEYKTSNKGAKLTLDQIRNKYGSQTINTSSYKTYSLQS